ncbi:GON domain-containing protein [Deinococcus sp. QL22]|uniref:GON domain-containing protein n=1 Tax=Deinococcus sp. QL22 TaxID=2939437 RepID=UPI002017D712|nr:GON domain-containing protein [Deinococcus sp. QL22]UQN09836.1 hypothetical protein M1R55_25570 [Deinococcus sp. QL22]
MPRSTPLPCLLVLTAVLSACSSVPVPPVPPPVGGNLQSSPAVTLSFIDGMQFASGYDSTTGGFLGTTSCLVPQAEPTVSAPSRLQQTFSLTKIESKSDLSDALDVSGKASYNAGVTKVSASAQFAQQQDTNSYSVGMLLKADAIGQNYALYDTITKPKLTDAMQQLYDTDYKAFKDSCGDYFLNTFTLGGRYVAYFSFTSYSKAQKTQIAAQLSASSGPFSISADFSKKMQSLASTSTLKINTFQTAIAGTPSTDLNTLISDAQNYSAKVLASCASADALKSCVKSATFNSYVNFFGPPDSKSADAINRGSAELTSLVLRGNLVENLLGSAKVIQLNPAIYDQTALNAVKTAIAAAPTWKLGINAAITACTNDITTCLPSAVSGTGAEADAEATYGPLPTYLTLSTALDALPDITAKLPTSCADQQTLYQQKNDQDYVMFLDQDLTRSYKLFCRDMATGQTPLDYLNLGSQSNTQSVVDFTDSQQSSNSGAKLSGKQTTTFTKIRIDPNTLIVNPNDVTYATSTGFLVRNDVPNNAAGAPPAIPLGNAGQCRPEAGAVNPVSTIDLSFTSFIFNTAATSFVSSGWDQREQGVATPSADKKSYAITAGRGWCSGTEPSQIRLLLVPN